MRLIDADEIEWVDISATDDVELATFPAFVNEQPTIDAVPVVRCKDCKHHRPGTAFTFIRNGQHLRYCSCEKWGRCVLDDDFCSYGERKEGDG